MMAICSDFCDGVILAGGQSRRMGQCKALLPLEGETILARIAKEMQMFPQCWLSANDPALSEAFPGKTVSDIFLHCGPLAGLHAVFTVTDKPYLFCVPCDMPFFCGELAKEMLDTFPNDVHALVCVDATGVVHPLCGISSRTALPEITKHLKNKEFRVMTLLETLRCAYFRADTRFPQRTFWNINTREAYHRLSGEGGPHAGRLRTDN